MEVLPNVVIGDETVCYGETIGFFRFGHERLKIGYLVAWKSVEDAVGADAEENADGTRHNAKNVVSLVVGHCERVPMPMGIQRAERREALIVKQG